MTKAFRVLAFLVAALVVVQAAAVAWGFFGLWKYLDGGDSVDSDVLDGEPFSEVAGFMIHGMNGMMVIPVLALVLLIIGFLAKFPGSTKFGAAIFLLVVLQVVLGIAGFSAPIIGALHGVNALVLFAVAAMAGVKAKDVPVAHVDDRARVNA
jgi:hypothetical protein